MYIVLGLAEKSTTLMGRGGSKRLADLLFTQTIDQQTTGSAVGVGRSAPSRSNGCSSERLVT